MSLSPAPTQNCSTQDLAQYDDAYIKWKNWDSYGSFGKLEKDQEVYYHAELKRARPRNILDVLEIGFGNGSFLSFCKKNNWQAVGVEENQSLVALGKKNGYEVFHSSELGLLESNSFDLIAAFDVIEHMDQDHLIHFFRSMYSLLKNDGVFLARFPNGDSPFGLHVQNGDATHVTAIGSGKADYFSKKTGFEIVFMGGAAQPIFCGRLAGSLRRLVIVPIKIVVEFFFKKIFFQNTKVNFLSPNLVVAFKKTT